MRTSLSFLALTLTVPAAAEAPTPYTRAIAAGYKAAMLCSGVFNAGRTEAQIERDELRGIYPEYQAIVPNLKATIDQRTASVAVAWSDTMPPRSSVWLKGTGCMTLPIGSVPLPITNRRQATQTGPAPADPRPWPMGDAGIAPQPSEKLAETIAKTFDHKTFGKDSETVGVVVLHNGRIIAERYREGFGPFVSNRTWSVAKSIAGMTIGAAQAQGKVNVAARVRIPEWGAWPYQDRRATITTDQLLRMSSGLHSDFAGNRTDAIYFGGAAVDEDATHWPLEAMPGTRFRYANNDILLAMRSLRARMADDRAYAGLVPGLLARLGMTHTVAETDWRGNYVLSSQVWSTARDLARFGLFLAQDGVWQGQRILPAGWMAESIRATGPQPEDREGYGRTLWLYGPRQGLPPGSFAAQGNRGQTVMVVPSHGLVIVRRGEDPGPARFDATRFSADVIAALR